MAGSPTKEVTPSNKRPRPSNKKNLRSDKKKRLTTSSITSITPVNFDSSESETERDDETMATANPAKDDNVQVNDFSP